MISLENVSKKFADKVILDNVSFSINKGQIVGLVGKSGNGKSTLARIILGRESIDSGRVLVDKSKVSIIFQEYSSSLNPKMNILQVLSEPFEIKKIKYDKELVDDLLSLSGFKNLDLTRKVTSLSGGEKQRISIVRMLILNPDFLIFDEATSSLDIHLQFQIIDLIKNICKSKNKGALFITHNIEMLKFLTDEVYMLENGKLRRIESEDTIRN